MESLPMDCISQDHFNVDKFIGRGCYSMVYKVTKTNGVDLDVSYALKRFFMENVSAYHCVKRERQILQRLYDADYQCIYLPVLYYSFVDSNVFAFVVREGSGTDMYDLIRHAGKLTEMEARFYLAELICALEHIHSLDIVHLDVKPENILCAFDGHTFLSDFDRSYDLTREVGKPTADDFTGTPLFMAPEIAKGDAITTKADIWSVAVLAAEMVCGPIRSDVKHTEEEFRLAREGRYNIRGLKKLSKPLQSFFAACFQHQYKLRPDIAAVKQLRFLKTTQWGKVHNGILTPPYHPSEIKHRPAKEDRCSVSSTDERLLAGAFSQARPMNLDSRQAKKNIQARSIVDAEDLENTPPAESCLQSDIDPTEFKEFAQTFEFIHKELQSSPKEAVPAESVEALVDLMAEFDTDDNEESIAAAKLAEISDESPVRRRRQRNLSIGD